MVLGCYYQAGNSPHAGILGAGDSSRCVHCHDNGYHGTVSSSPAYYKTIPDNLVVTVTKVGDSATTDRLWVANIHGTSDGFDGAYDAWKMTNGPTMPNVFTLDLGERIAINATEIDAAKVLPMGFSYAVAGEKFGVRLEQVTGGQYYDVYLEDKLTASYHDLNQSDYAFTHQGWTQEGPRFALHFSLSTVGVEEPNAADLFVAYQNQDRIMLRSIGEGFSAYRLYGLNGQELSRGPLDPGMQSIAAPTSAGLYLIEAYGPQGTSAPKIHMYTSLSMKNIIASIMLLCRSIARGQDSENAFEEAFEDMFQYEEPVWIPQNTPPPPPVPLDGGLVALLAAGGAVAYKKYRSAKA